MELKDVYDLWERFDQSDATEFELSVAGDSIKLKRTAEVIPAVESIVAPGEIVSSTIEETPEKKDVQPNGIVVKAPLVGTFYKAPSANDKPFIEVGQKVKKGDVIGIIEAMKLMNEVLSTADGEVVQILVEDGSMVEFDQSLVIIK